ncbi:MAG: flagellar biosynthetic protein FliR [Syntrophorhabdaceae bacterium]|nr:flagellar biosynthetic protein FliR [Syntrophorhabdaceae bacterium]
MTDIAITFEIQRFLLVFFRVAAVLFMIPLFTSRSVSAMFKGGLSLMIAYLLYDIVRTNVVVHQDSFMLFIMCAKEVFVGATIGFIVRLVFVSASMSGEIISLQAGLGFARFMDPYSQQQVSILEQIKNLIALLIFFVIDAHHMVIKGIAYSLRELPIGAVTLHSSLAGFLVSATGSIFGAAFRIGAPIIVTLFLVELAFGMLSRMIPQANVFVDAIPVKILITVLMLGMSLGYIVPNISGLFRGLETDFIRVIRMMG